MNETLEAMARAIFQSWFVDFDPVRAKAKGRDTGLPPEIAALFPSELVEVEGREVPKGWGVGTISEWCIRVENGGTPRRDNPEYWNPPKIPWLTSGEVRQDITISTENMISELGFANCSAKMWPKGATIVALYGATAG
jgi:type I restriction enzyme S subunit